MNDELSEPLKIELLAASLRADYTDTQAFLEALAVKLQGSLPDHTTVKRQGSLFSREHPVKEITVVLGGNRYRINWEGHGPPLAQRMTVVRGIVLKTEQISVDQWIEELARALAAFATQNANAYAALNRFLLQ
jgi:hypothetical protein